MKTRATATPFDAIASQLSPVGAALYRLIGRDLLDAERQRQKRESAERRKVSRAKRSRRAR